MQTRAVLIRLLLIIAFLQAVVGMPLHEAGHLRQLAQSTPTAEASAGLSVDQSEQSDHTETDRLCTLCLAYSALATALPSDSTLVIAGADDAAQAWTATVIAFAPQGWRTRFAARDPPKTLS